MKQLKFENLVTKEKETPEIIPIRADGLQPRKIEELLSDIDILPDTYVIYPTGGYHLFYGLPNTLPRYQEKIWPYAKRIKYTHRGRIHKQGRPDHDNSQGNLFFGTDGYPVFEMIRSSSRLTYDGGRTRRVPKVTIQRFHRLVALAWIPNPKNKPFVMHINDDATNYLIENLKWGTGRENQKGKIRKQPDTMEQKYLNLINRGIIKG